MKSHVCAFICFTLIMFVLGIAGAIILKVSDENKCGDGCFTKNCLTYPCTCGLSCEDYAIKSNNEGNTNYFVGVALIATGFGSLALVILGFFCFGLVTTIIKKIKNKEEIKNGNINMVQTSNRKVEQDNMQSK